VVEIGVTILLCVVLVGNHFDAWLLEVAGTIHLL
jgi:hypothetical protein